jgi:hypothetical protein
MMEIEDKKIDEALALLNELARDKKAELLGMIAGKFDDLKSALALGADAQPRMPYARGEEKVRDFASKVDETVYRVHKSPWRYLGATALGFLIFGYLFGRSKK